jgi:hypothetical protein
LGECTPNVRLIGLVFFDPQGNGCRVDWDGLSGIECPPSERYRCASKDEPFAPLEQREKLVDSRLGIVNTWLEAGDAAGSEWMVRCWQAHKTDS